MFSSGSAESLAMFSWLYCLGLHSLPWSSDTPCADKYSLLSVLKYRWPPLPGSDYGVQHTDKQVCCCDDLEGWMYASACTEGPEHGDFPFWYAPLSQYTNTGSPFSSFPSHSGPQDPYQKITPLFLPLTCVPSSISQYLKSPLPSWWGQESFASCLLCGTAWC